MVVMKFAEKSSRLYNKCTRTLIFYKVEPLNIFFWVCKDQEGQYDLFGNVRYWERQEQVAVSAMY